MFFLRNYSRHIKLFKDIHILNKCSIWNFLLKIKILKKNFIKVSTKIMSSTTVFNINNYKKAFLKQLVSILCGTEDWSKSWRKLYILVK